MEAHHHTIKSNPAKRLYKILLLYITIVCLHSLHNTATAQYYDSYERNMRLGFVFSPNYSWLKYKNDQSQTGQVGYQYGLTADFGFSQNYYVNTGLLINAMKASVDGEDAREIELKYAEIPLAIKLKTYPGRFGRFYGLFGFTGGLKVSGKEWLNNQDDSKPIDGDDLFRLALQMGIGNEWNLGRNLGLLTGITFNNGFTRVIRENGNPKSSYIALNLGLLF